MPRKHSDLLTVRCEVMRSRRVEGQIVADVLSCGHEFLIQETSDKFKTEHVCNICTVAKFGERPKRSNSAKVKTFSKKKPKQEI